MNVFLIGFRCTGKTMVGKTLAKRTGHAFVDADERLTEKAGRTIAELVQEYGWDDFRRREREVILSICRRNGQVVATGGGAVLDPGNVAAMKSCGKLVWLRAQPPTIRSRMQQDSMTARQRPALTSQGTTDEIESALKERMPIYGAAMDFAVDTDDRAIEEICETILNWLAQFKE